jgi:hypothetical protein
VRQGRELGEQARLDLLHPVEPVELGPPLRVDQRLDRLKARGEAGRHEVLPLADEEAQLRPLPPRSKLSHELEARVGGRGDQAVHSMELA